MSCIKSADTDKREEMVEESQMRINKNQKKLVKLKDEETKDGITRNMKQRKCELVKE
jgi:hypothetical protein